MSPVTGSASALRALAIVRRGDGERSLAVEMVPFAHRTVAAQVALVA